MPTPALSYLPAGVEPSSLSLAHAALLVSLVPLATNGGLRFLTWSRDWSFTPKLIAWVVLWTFLVAPAIALVLAVISLFKRSPSRWPAVVAIVISTIALGLIVFDV